MRDEFSQHAESLDDSRLNIQITILNGLYKKGPTSIHEVDWFFIDENKDYSQGDSNRTIAELKSLYEKRWVSDVSEHTAPQTTLLEDRSVSTPRPSMPSVLFITALGESGLKALLTERNNRRMRGLKKEKRNKVVFGRILTLRHVFDFLLIVVGFIFMVLRFGDNISVDLDFISYEGLFGGILMILGIVDALKPLDKK